MNSASAGLTGAQQAQFRQANATWEQIKSTYDNPQHPFYYAMRANQPELALERCSSAVQPSRGRCKKS